MTGGRFPGHRIRILHVVTHPIQYFAPLYRRISTYPGIELIVWFESDFGITGGYDREFRRELKWDGPLLNGYQHRVLSSHSRPSWIRSLVSLWSVIGALMMRRFDVIWIHGYNSRRAWLLILLANLRRVPVLLREEATLLDRRPAWRRLVKAALLPPLLRCVTGLYIGAENRRFFERYGTRKHRLYFTPYSVDNEFFQSAAKRLLPLRSQLREKFGVPRSIPIILFAAKLISKKNPLGLLEAFASVRRTDECALLMVGDGPLKGFLEELVREQAIRDVYFAGFMNQSEMPMAYAAADIFVLPSIEKETWGLAVNEAMNFGLPIVVSDKVGCAADLVHDAVNGTVVPAGSSEALAAALTALVRSPESRTEFGREAKITISDWDIGNTAQGIITAAVESVARQWKDPGLDS
jgi:glycosyltransferase involved in cell wall biosynthesis